MDRASVGSAHDYLERALKYRRLSERTEHLELAHELAKLAEGYLVLAEKAQRVATAGKGILVDDRAMEP